MQKEKNGFLLYTGYFECIQTLEREQKGALFEAIFIYEMTGTVIELDAAAQMAFNFIKKDLDLNREKYEQKCKRNSDNGAKGGRGAAKTARGSIDPGGKAQADIGNTNTDCPDEQVKNTPAEKSERFKSDDEKANALEKSERFNKNRTVKNKADNDNEHDNEHDNDFSFKKEKGAREVFSSAEIRTEGSAGLFDPYHGKYISLFQGLYREIIQKPFMPKDVHEREKLCGCLACVLQDVGEAGMESAIKRILEVLNNLTFDKKKPYLPWLMTDSNFIKVYSGEFDYVLCDNPEASTAGDEIDSYIQRKMREEECQ